MLKIADSGLLNAQIARTAIWISSWKLYLSSAAAVWLAAAGRGTAPSPGAGSPAPASSPSPAGGVGSSSAGRAPFSPAAGAGEVPVAPAQPCRTHLLCRRASCRAGAPPAGLVRTKPRCTSLQAHDVVMEVAQHFGKNIVKSVFGEVWFRSDSRRDIITKLPLKTVALAA